jgi:hypothetical protein
MRMLDSLRRVRAKPAAEAKVGISNESALKGQRNLRPVLVRSSPPSSNAKINQSLGRCVSTQEFCLEWSGAA